MRELCFVMFSYLRSSDAITLSSLSIFHKKVMPLITCWRHRFRDPPELPQHLSEDHPAQRDAAFKLMHARRLLPRQIRRRMKPTASRKCFRRALERHWRFFRENYRRRLLRCSHILAPAGSILADPPPLCSKRCLV